MSRAGVNSIVGTWIFDRITLQEKSQIAKMQKKWLFNKIFFLSRLKGLNKTFSLIPYPFFSLKDCMNKANQTFINTNRLLNLIIRTRGYIFKDLTLSSALNSSLGNLYRLF